MLGANCHSAKTCYFVLDVNAGLCNSDKAQWTIMRPAESISIPTRCRSVIAFRCTARKSAADMSGSISERKINLDFVLSSPCSAPALSTSFTAPTLRLTPSERRNWSAMAMNRCA